MVLFYIYLVITLLSWVPTILFLAGFLAAIVGVYVVVKKKTDEQFRGEGEHPKRN